MGWRLNKNPRNIFTTLDSRNRAGGLFIRHTVTATVSVTNFLMGVTEGTLMGVTTIYRPRVDPTLQGTSFLGYKN